MDEIPVEVIRDHDVADHQADQTDEPNTSGAADEWNDQHLGTSNNRQSLPQIGFKGFSDQLANRRPGDLGPFFDLDIVATGIEEKRNSDQHQSAQQELANGFRRAEPLDGTEP